MEDIVKRYTTPDKRLAIANALVEVEDRLLGLEEAMAFFSNWYNKTQRGPEILLPDTSNENGTSKIILPNG